MPEIVMAAGTSIITERSPYIVRTSFTLAQQSTMPIADWAAKNGIKKVVTMTSDYAPGNDAELNPSSSISRRRRRQVVERSRCRWPIPISRRSCSARMPSPTRCSCSFRPGRAATSKQFVERGLDKSGIKMIGPGDVTDDDLLNGMGDAMLGTVTAHFYSAAHPSALNKAVRRRLQEGLRHRANFMAVGGYDGMHLIYEALKKTGGKTDGDSLIEAMKGMAWESPRGPISIDPETRDIVQNVYIRKVEKVDGERHCRRHAATRGLCSSALRAGRRLRTDRGRHSCFGQRDESAAPSRRRATAEPDRHPSG
jgi:branched-chain amino acid transport system substrate-binding protein